MANSTNLRADAVTLHTTAFSSATLARTSFLDADTYLSNLTYLVQQTLDTAKRQLMVLAAHCDPADPQLVLINNLLGTFG